MKVFLYWLQIRKFHPGHPCDNDRIMSDTTNTQPQIEPTFPEPKMTRAQELMRSRYGMGLLAGISFVESFLPLPILTDPFLAAAILIDRSRAKTMVLITMVSSVVGGVAAYLLAAHFKDVLFQAISPEMTETLNSLLAAGQDTLILTIVGAFTPIPYTIVAWAVALSSGNIFIFIIGSILGRSARYMIVGWCAYVFGPAALKYAQRSIFLTSLIIFVLVAIYIWIKM